MGVEPPVTVRGGSTPMCEAYVHGVSTRSVDDLVKAMGMSGISKSRVSRLCEEIDENSSGLLTFDEALDECARLNAEVAGLPGQEELSRSDWGSLRGEEAGGCTPPASPSGGIRTTLVRDLARNRLSSPGRRPPSRLGVITRQSHQRAVSSGPARLAAQVAECAALLLISAFELAARM
jgi:hypothetical protein